MFAVRWRRARCSLLDSADLTASTRVVIEPGKEERSAIRWQKCIRSLLSSGDWRISIIRRMSRWKVVRSAAKYVGQEIDDIVVMGWWCVWINSVGYVVVVLDGPGGIENGK